MKLIDPVVAPTAVAGSLAPRLDSLEGKRIGLWSNNKKNSTELLRQVEFELRARHAIAGVVTGEYNPARVMRTDEWVAIDTCDAVILANGDCGSCSSTGLLNQIALERRGIPALLIATDRFRSALEVTRQIAGVKDLRWAEVPHPISSLSTDQLRDRARQAIDQFEAIVVDLESRSVKV